MFKIKTEYVGIGIVLIVCLFSGWAILNIAEGLNSNPFEVEEVEYPYNEVVKIPMGADTLHITTIYFNQEEEISMLHSFLTDGIVYTGYYSDIESLVAISQKHRPTEEDLQHMNSYYQNIIEEDLWMQ